MMRKHYLYLLTILFLTVSVKSQIFYVNEDFNTATLPAGWNNTAVVGTVPWTFGIDGSDIESGNNNIDNSNFVYFDDDLQGLSGTNTVQLTTPSFDNTGSSVTLLEFDYNYRDYNSTSTTDTFYVEVYDGTSWNRVFSTQTNDDCGQYSQGLCLAGFPKATINISAFSNVNCQVRFTYFDGNDWCWYVGLDNVVIKSPFPNDIGVAEVIDPTSGCGLSSTQPVAVKIKNYGTQSATNFNAVVALNGSVVLNENVTATIPAGDSLIYNFTGTVNMQNVAIYDFAAYTNYTSDGRNDNDSVVTQIQNEPLNTLTYTDNFEGATSLWKVEGTNPSWQRGVPANSIINSATSGVNAFVTNLSGNYNSDELSYLVSPCFSFVGGIGDPILSFNMNYNTEVRYDTITFESSIDNGLTWQTVNAGPNATNWFNVGSHWEGSSGGWISVENILTGFVGQSSVKFRFKLDSDPGINREGVAIDDFSIRYPQPTDISANQLLYPSTAGAPICGYGMENIVVELENKGASPIDTVFMFYKVDNNPIVSDTFASTLAPNARFNFRFNTPANFAAATNYNLDVWAVVPGDGFMPNDSILNRTVTGGPAPQTLGLPVLETFDGAGWVASAAFNGTGDIIQAPWERNPGSNTSLAWHVRATTTGSTNTGPDVAHSQPNFMYIETSSAGPVANPTLVSPCVNLGNVSGAILEYWYYKYGTNVQDIFVEVYNGASWVEVDRIPGQTHTSGADPWLKRTIDLTNFAGQRIKVRFLGSYSACCTGDVAIDDVNIFKRSGKDALAKAVTAPTSGCDVNSTSTISIDIQNNGAEPILNGTMTVGYQIDGGPKVVENFTGIINSDQTASYTFATTADLSIPNKTYIVKIWTDLAGDEERDNDTLYRNKIINEVKTVPYFDDFETFRYSDCAALLGQVFENGWTATSSGTFNWKVQSSFCGKGSAVTPTANTGPDGDKTNTNGIFLYTEGDGVGTADLLSPCIDLSGTTNPRISFFYHRYGAQMSDLSVDVIENGIETLDVIKLTGENQTSAAQQWKNAVVDLSAFVGSSIQVRFRSVRGVGNLTDNAIDDFYLYEAQNADAGITEINNPTGDACGLTNGTVTVNIHNFGMQAIPANTLNVKYNDNNGAFVTELVPTAIAPGGDLSYTFTTPVDLSAAGYHDILATTDLTGDIITKNNSSMKRLTNRQPGFPRYFQDFEHFVAVDGYNGDDLRGFTRNPNTYVQNQGYMWHVQCGPSPSGADGAMGAPPPIPQGPPTGPSGDHTFSDWLKNGRGCYMMMESNLWQTYNVTPPSIPDATLELACGPMDFRNSANGKIQLSFWYHMFGPETGDLFVDVHNNVNSSASWINNVAVIRGPQQTEDTDKWKKYSVALDRFATDSNVRIRFRAADAYIPGNAGSGRGGDIAIDDIEILDRKSRDAAMVRVLDPTSDCMMGAAEDFRVEVQNLGTQDILQTYVGYQLTFTPLGGVPIVYPAVQDTVIGQTIRPLAKISYQFKDPIDMSAFGRYEFKYWTNYLNDQYDFNDTLTHTITNVSRPFPYCETFSDLLLLDEAKMGIDGQFINNWKSNETGLAFKASLLGNADVPLVGGTNGDKNDVYMLTIEPPPMGSLGATPFLETTCYDLTQAAAANLEFSYIMPHEDGVIYIEARVAGQGGFRRIDTIFGKSQVAFDWRKRTVVLSDFIGQFVEFRFEAQGLGVAGNYYAIDDVCVIEPDPQQVLMQRILSPLNGLCYYPVDQTVSIRLQNVGVDRIDKFKIVLGVDKGGLSLTRDNYFRDTIEINASAQLPYFNPGTRYDVDLNFPGWQIDMTDKVKYFFHVYVILPGDNDTTDNRIVDYEVEHPIARNLAHIVDFEDPVDPFNGWLPSNDIPYGGMDYFWDLKTGQNSFGLTGPDVDHTLGPVNTAGHYLVSQSVNGATGDAIQFLSQCMDLVNTTSPEIKYWYHKFGATMGDLYLEANNDSGWVQIDRYTGQDPDQRTGGLTPWKSRTVNLNRFRGQFVKFRFISTRGDGDQSDMAIDDIGIYDQPAVDLAPVDLNEPNIDSSYCYSATNPLKVNIRNNGSDSLDFTVDNMDIEVIIKKDNQGDGVFNNLATLNTTVTTNPFTGGVPLPRDSIAIVDMGSTFDMSDIGSFYQFEIRISLASDLISSNDTTDQEILAQRKAGSIQPLILPANDTVCYLTPVLLNVEGYFGALRWEDKRILNNGNGVFDFPSGSPFDERIYLPALDTTTEFRVRVCPQLISEGVNEFSDTMRIEVIKPYKPEGIYTTRCLNKPFTVDKDTIYATAVSNITSVNFYAEIDDVLRFGSDDDSDDGDGIYRAYINRLQETGDTTFYIESVITLPQVQSLNGNGLECYSFNRDSVIKNIGTLPSYDLPKDTVDLCKNDVLPLEQTSYFLDAGQLPGRKDTYDWKMYRYDEATQTNVLVRTYNTQTVVVDALQLDSLTTYTYTLYVETDEGCNLMKVDKAVFYIDDECTVSLDDIAFEERLEVYPNPVSEDLNIMFKSSESLTGTVTLLSVEGQEIEIFRDVNFKNLQMQVNMGDLPKGVYFIKISTDDGNITKKIVKS